jgi:hypothetical protein
MVVSWPPTSSGKSKRYLAMHPMTSRFDHFKSVFFEWCSQGIMGHCIAFIIYPQDEKACIFDSLRETNKVGTSTLKAY